MLIAIYFRQSFVRFRDRSVEVKWESCLACSENFGFVEVEGVFGLRSLHQVQLRERMTKRRMGMQGQRDKGINYDRSWSLYAACTRRPVRGGWDAEVGSCVLYDAESWSVAGFVVCLAG